MLARVKQFHSYPIIAVTLMLLAARDQLPVVSFEKEPAHYIQQRRKCRPSVPLRRAAGANDPKISYWRDNPAF